MSSSAADWAKEVAMSSGGSVTRLTQLIRSDDPELRQVALLRLGGCANREIADRLDCTERSFEWRFEHIRRLWANCALDP
jgi:hypothetical protein